MSDSVIASSTNLRALEEQTWPNNDQAEQREQSGNFDADDMNKFDEQMLTQMLEASSAQTSNQSQMKDEVHSVASNRSQQSASPRQVDQGFNRSLVKEVTDVPSNAEQTTSAARVEQVSIHSQQTASPRQAYNQSLVKDEVHSIASDRSQQALRRQQSGSFDNVDVDWTI